MIHLALEPVGGYAIVTVAAALLVAVLWLGPPRARTTAGRRRVLATLRGVAVLLTLLGLLRPTIVYTQFRKQSSTLLILADGSRSMLTADAAGNRTRWQALRDALGDSASTLESLAESVEVRGYLFAEQAELFAEPPGKWKLRDEPIGRQTALGAVLEDVLAKEAGKRLAGVILLSDGAQRAYAPRDTAPEIAARRLGDLGYPIYALPLGQPRGAGQSKDVALSDLDVVGETVFVKNELTARAQTRFSGLVNQAVPIELLFETAPGTMSVVASEPVSATSDGQQLAVERTYVPQVPGEFKLTLRAPPQPGEAIVTNNELSTFITVRKGGINVLYLEGDLQRVEKRFLRAALDGSPNIKIDYLYFDAQNPKQHPAELTEDFQPGKYDVYLIGDIDSRGFTPEELTALRSAVEAGAGLMMLGGLHTFGPGGYQSTALNDILPIEMGQFERQPFGEAVAQDLHLAGPVAMRPTLLGQRHFILMLDEAARNDRLWSELPPLLGANRFRGLRPRGNVLAEGPMKEPLLVAQDAGRGRVLAFAGDSTWRWVLAGHESAHRRFWRQVVLWLARKDQSNEGEVWVELQPRRYAPNRRVEFTAGARAADGQSLEGVTFTGEITLPDGTKKPVGLDRQGDRASGAWSETAAPGDYALEVTARQNDQTLGSARARFLVYEQDLELENPAADPDLLTSLADATEGETLAPEELPALLERLAAKRLNQEVASETSQTLWDTWPFFLLFAGALTCEWFLRKRWGLV